jgi:hypothetical protein
VYTSPGTHLTSMNLIYLSCYGSRDVVSCKVQVRTGHESPDGEQSYSSTPSLTLALGGGWVVNPTPQSLYLRERDPYPRTEDWVGPRAVLDGCTVIRSPDPPTRSESRYGLSCPGPLSACFMNFFLLSLLFPVRISRIIFRSCQECVRMQGVYEKLDLVLYTFYGLFCFVILTSSTYSQ